MRQGKYIGSGMGVVLCLLFILGFGIQPALAATNLYCDPTIRSQLDKQTADAFNRMQSRVGAGFPTPDKFDSLFCGAQITNMFNSLTQSLASTIFGQIRGLVDNLMRQACNAAVAPLQMAANAICIPAFNFNLNFSLPSTGSTGVCNGTPLFNVTPVYQGNYSYPGATLPAVTLP